ncbi:MAG: hypothetical protein JJT88_10580 [Gammaproteobacteria bacterium]|nr:hypothetical protein [Gammaproteobacteria bacterium]
MTPSFREILEALNQHEVEYMVVGGVAAVIHGAPTTTFDLDALVRLSDANAERLARALSELDARFREHRAILRPTVEDILGGGHLLLMTRAGPLDVLGFIGEQQRYEDLLGESSEIETSMGSLRVLNLEALIDEKKRMGRAKDIAAVELLEEVLRHRKLLG